MATPEAGWYPDPEGSSRLRFFDSEVWTEHYHDPQAPAATTFAATSSPQPRSRELPSAAALMAHAWSCVKALIGPLLGLTFATGVVIAMIYGLFFWWFLSQVNNPTNFDSFNNGFGSFLVAYFIMGFVLGALYSLYALMMARLMQLHYRGHKATLAAALATAKQRLWSFYGTSLLLYIGFNIALFVLFLVLALIHPASAVLAFVPIIIAWVKLGFLPIAAVATDRRQSMIASSTGVSQGRFFAVLGRLIVLALPLILTYAIGVVILIAAGRSGDDSAAFILIPIVFALGGALSIWILAAGSTKLYLDSGAPSDI